MSIPGDDGKEIRVAFTLFNYITVSRLEVQSAAPLFRIWQAAGCLSPICLSYNSD